MFSADERSRYSRHFLLPGVGETGQERLKAARVLIVGLGGLGSPAALYLAGAGIGTLGLVDDDRVSISNLQRQILYSSEKTEQPKTLAAQERLANLNPHLEIKLHAHKFDRSNARELVETYDLVLDGTDNFESRYVIARACADFKKPHLYAGLFRFEGQLALFEPGHACYACLFPKAPKQEDVPNCSEAGVLGPLAGALGTLQALEALKYFLGLRSSKDELILFDGLTLRTDALKISRRADCICCSKPDSEFWSQTSIPTQDILALKDRPDGAWTLDVRNRDEVERQPAQIERLIHIPLQELKTRLHELDTKKTYITLCQSGKRSLRAQVVLLDAGFQNVWNLRSGLNG